MSGGKIAPDHETLYYPIMITQKDASNTIQVASLISRHLFGSEASRVRIEIVDEGNAKLIPPGDSPRVLIRPDAVSLSELPGTTWPITTSESGKIKIEGLESMRESLLVLMRDRLYSSKPTLSSPSDTELPSPDNSPNPEQPL